MQWITAISTIILAGVAVYQIISNYKFNKAELIVQRNSLHTYLIRNIGNNIAYNISVSVEGDVPDNYKIHALSLLNPGEGLLLTFDQKIVDHYIIHNTVNEDEDKLGLKLKLKYDTRFRKSPITETVDLEVLEEMNKSIPQDMEKERLQLPKPLID